MHSVEFYFPELLTIDVDVQYIIDALVMKATYHQSNDVEKEKKLLLDCLFKDVDEWEEGQPADRENEDIAVIESDDEVEATTSNASNSDEVKGLRNASIYDTSFYDHCSIYGSNVSICFTNSNTYQPAVTVGAVPNYFKSLPSVEMLDGLQWDKERVLPVPAAKSQFGKTRIKDTFQGKFSTLLISFLRFLPIPIWDKLVLEANWYALQTIAKQGHNCVVGYVWRNVEIQEFMIFFSILLHMTLVVITGKWYMAYWDDPAKYPFIKTMSKAQFKQIHSTLHCNNNEAAEESNDLLHKIWPLLNILKETLGAFVNVGNELAIDEASIASRSQFGKQFIFFNSAKSCGKFYYHLFFLNNCDHYNMVWFRMAT